MLLHEIPVNAIEDADVFAIVADSIKKVSKAGLYFAIKISDKSGEIAARKWNVEQDAEAPTPGTVWKFRGNMGLWSDKKQFTIKQMRLAEIGEYDESTLVRTTALDVSAMFSALHVMINGIKSEFLRRVVAHIFFDCEEKLARYPAAKGMHHAYVGGLLEHIYKMARSADLLSNVYSELNRDVLIAGVLLHDIGKLLELRKVGLTTVYTIAGSLLGHLVLGLNIIDHAARCTLEEELRSPRDEELLLMTKHAVASHHGRLEWGAVKVPMTTEALVVHQLDVLDARLNNAADSLITAVDGECTEYNQAWDTYLYKENNL